MERKHLMLIDGYNAIHRMPALEVKLDQSLLSARTALIRHCSNWMACRRDVWMFFVVFDGSSAVSPISSESAHDVRAVFTRSGETADDRILAMIRERSTDRITVVTDDRYIRDNARSYSATPMSVQEFFAVTDRGRNTHSGQGRDGSKTGLSSAQERQITDDLKDIWS